VQETIAKLNNMRKKETTKAPKVEKSILVEETTIEKLLEEVIVKDEPIYTPTLSNIQKQCGLTVENLSSLDYSPSVELKLMFADIMETMHNYHMSCESKNQARYNDIMNHIVTSCELVNTFVK
jgi:hypothetical protein